MSFAVAYGLGLQMLQQTTIRTSLLPPEIRTARMIRRKKPWAVATAATLMAGLCLSTMGFAIAKSTVTVEKWKKAEDAVAAVLPHVLLSCSLLRQDAGVGLVFS